MVEGEEHKDSMNRSGGELKAAQVSDRRTTCEDLDERQFHVGGVQSRRLNEHEALLLCVREEEPAVSNQ